MMLPFWLLVAAACVPVHDSVLHGSDLAAADPQFAAVEAGLAFGYAPVPGSRRVISEAEMARHARRLGIEAKAHEVCFQYAMRKLDSAAVLSAMEEIVPGSKIEILDTANFDVPEGKLSFSLASLPKPPISHPEQPVIWRGHIEYAQNRHFTIWARVRISGNEADVLRGDEVTVHVQAGAAQLKIAARAETKGALGETVKLRNPKSGKVFEAQVTGKKTASVVTSAEFGQ